jgi:signal transduction histidine kinase
MIGRTMTRAFRTAPWLTAAWLLLLGGYTAVAVWAPAGAGRTAFGDIFQCVLPLLVNGALLMNAITPNWRKNAFWMLLALGCSLGLGGQVVWTYVDVYRHRVLPDPFLGDIVFFLRTLPMIAALTMQPHKQHDNRKTLYGYVDFSLLLCWWVYLYLIAVIPWQFIAIDDARYNQAYNVICAFENLVFVAGALLLSARAAGRWRRIYAHLAGAGAAYTFGSLLVSLAIHRGVYSTGSLYDLPMIASLLWLGTAGVASYSSRSETSNGETKEREERSSGSAPRQEAVWASRLGRTALLSLPLFGIWCVKTTQAPMAVHEFRILVTLAAVLPMGFLVFLRYELINAERLRLLRASQESIDNLKRLQMQFVQSEKLASLGQLAAGAAHEINNPLTAILGYSELLIDDPAVGERPRSLAEKIRDQARRAKMLVNNLLSFARQVPSEQRSLVDVNAVVTSSAQLRRLDLRGKNIRIELQTGAAIPAVRGDPNQLLQVFFNIINNAVEAMEEVNGGTLTVRTLCERGNVVILFSDTGPGVSEPRLVFDPFYTTKPVGKGTGLGLSICYGLVHDHGGQISCSNRPEGGATFRIELPAAPAMFPSFGISPTPRGTPAKLT